MKRILLLFSLVVCLLVVGQAACFAESMPVTSSDDPGFSETVTAPTTDTDWQTNPSFNSFAEAPPALSAEESTAVSAKEAGLARSLKAGAQSSTSLYSALNGTTEADWSGSVADPGLMESALPLPGVWYAWIKLPNYDQGTTPYCGPYSALQILRYKGYYEPYLLRHLIKEMYIPGQGTSIYRLANSLNKRLSFTYWVSDVGSPAGYAYKHVIDIRDCKMPLDNLVRIRGGLFGRYKHNHGGHFIDSNGYHFNSNRGFAYILVTDTYNEEREGGGNTLGRNWIPFWQMYGAVARHPLHKVVW